ncbi:monoamine oxidase [Nocardioides szechwanensis]|uniref:Monoamine oxidase n=1 Tax=Nocardioides szechwanensis TaxID=1005944 RepID=A0A1H0FCK1_9ACTN|nr:FAD-dependent oxidoreductase [Nocardioides szechwanensis]GEP36190.1 monoamine oxidase [Nocardioides szechwanensis]SDN92286.1 monoamine oxidase [Nocardioides szechwanensis]
MNDLSLTRRGVLGGTALGGAALGTGAFAGLTETALAAPGTGGPQGLQGDLPRQVDVVVVGAGIAGLVAARKVARAGRSVLLVEARHRVGGRVLNHRLDGGETIESGGAFVGPTQDHILALARELKVPTFLEYNTGNSVYISSTTGRMEYTGTVPPDPTILPDAAVLLARIDQYAAEINVDAPWAHPSAAEWDAMTLGEFIRRNAANAAGVTNLIKSWTQPGFGADPDELSFLYVLWYVACSGNERNVGTFARNSDTANGAQERRFVGGSQLIPLRLARRLGDIVALAAPVDRIEQRDHRVVVHTGRGKVVARRVIVAAPPPMVLGIDWFPKLPTRRLQLLRHLDMGQLMKCDAIYRTPFWRADGLNGFGLNDAGAARAVFDNTPKSGGPGVLLAFVGGSTWRKYGVMSKAARRKHVLEGFAEMFGPQALRPIDYVEHDWTRERWTGGGPTAIHAPGTLLQFGSAIRKPFGRVHWAGTETSTYWSGYMDGAVRSGKRAATEVLEKM